MNNYANEDVGKEFIRDRKYIDDYLPMYFTYRAMGIPALPIYRAMGIPALPIGPWVYLLYL
jgi:hypothetical protein